MHLIRRALSLGLALALVGCAASPSVADLKPEAATTAVVLEAAIRPEIAVVAVVPRAIAAPVADGVPQDPALLAVASGQPVFIEFYTDW
ncbi:MAG: hypothetical protein ABIQ99_00950 [Thermoflexales bacterium]